MFLCNSILLNFQSLKSNENDIEFSKRVTFFELSEITQIFAQIIIMKYFCEFLFISYFFFFLIAVSRCQMTYSQKNLILIIAFHYISFFFISKVYFLEYFAYEIRENFEHLFSLFEVI
jgi:hypothetical protein